MKIIVAGSLMGIFSPLIFCGIAARFFANAIVFGWQIGDAFFDFLAEKI